MREKLGAAALAAGAFLLILGYIIGMSYLTAQPDVHYYLEKQARGR